MNAPLLPAPRSMVERKPKHGQPCNNCGLCCFISLCPLAQRVFLRAEPVKGRPVRGPCPALLIADDKTSRCGLVLAPSRRRAASPIVASSTPGTNTDLLGHRLRLPR